MQTGWDDGTGVKGMEWSWWREVELNSLLDHKNSGRIVSLSYPNVIILVHVG